MDYIVLVAVFLTGAFIGYCCSTVVHRNDYEKGYKQCIRDQRSKSVYLYRDCD